MKAELSNIHAVIDRGGHRLIAFDLLGHRARAFVNQKRVFLDRGVVRLSPGLQPPQHVWSDHIEPLNLDLSDTPGYENITSHVLEGAVVSPELVKLMDEWNAGIGSPGRRDDQTIVVTLDLKPDGDGATAPRQ